MGLTARAVRGYILPQAEQEWIEGFAWMVNTGGNKRRGSKASWIEPSTEDLSLRQFSVGSHAIDCIRKVFGQDAFHNLWRDVKLGA
jgi:hypothetical protein